MKQTVAKPYARILIASLLAGICMPVSASAAQPVSQAARNGGADALDACAAEAYDSGDSAQAAELWQRAANAGGRDAMTALGALLEEGDGVSANLDLAREWYIRAADRGEPHAMVLLAIERLSHDPADQKGLSLMTRAASLGHDFAKRRLAALSGEAVDNSDGSIEDEQ